MRKFIVQTLKGTTSVVEVEAREVTRMEDPGTINLKPGESLYFVTAPDSIKGERYYSWYFYDTADEAMASAVSGLRMDVERIARRAHVEFDEASFELRVKEIKIINL